MLRYGQIQDSRRPVLQAHSQVELRAHTIHGIQ